MNDNMNEAVIYRPYKAGSWAFVITIPCTIMSFMIAGNCFLHAINPVLFCTGLGILGIWSTKVIYDASRIVVSFDEKRLRIFGISYSDSRDILWEELAYACYVRNGKGTLCIMLSPRALSYKEAKHVLLRGEGNARICFGDMVVFAIGTGKEVSQLKELVEKHAVRVDTY